MNKAQKVLSMFVEGDAFAALDDDSIQIMRGLEKIFLDNFRDKSPAELDRVVSLPNTGGSYGDDGRVYSVDIKSQKTNKFVWTISIGSDVAYLGEVNIKGKRSLDKNLIKKFQKEVEDFLKPILKKAKLNPKMKWS